MSSAAPQFRRHFLTWREPWLPQVAAWLAGGWDGGEALDLSRVLAVVPTRQAGRRLREALAERAAAVSSAVFPPRTYTPDTLLQLGAAGADRATRLEAALAWVEVLREIDLAEVPDVFPVAPPRRDFAWAWRLAGSLVQLQTQLAEGGLSLAEVPARAAGGCPEESRWRQLAELEHRQVARLAALGLREPHAVRLAWARNPPRPEGIDRVVVLAVADPLSLAMTVLAHWAAEMPVEVVVLAPAEEADSFDLHGRPRAEVWGRREIVLPDFEQRVQLCADPAAAADRVAAIARQYESPDGRVAIGVADPEVVHGVEKSLRRVGLAGYNPEGKSGRADRLHGLLAALAALAREPTIEAVGTLLRCPDFLMAMRARGAGEFAASRCLREFDEACGRHLPADLPDLRRVVPSRAADLVRALDRVDEIQSLLRRGRFPAGAAAALADLFRERQFDLAQPEDARAAAAVEAWREVMRECAAAAPGFPGVAANDWWEVALRNFGDGRRSEEKPAGALDLQGWLELLWEDAPHLVVVGMNDGLVPDAVVGDAFLPEALRERLGLKTNAQRLARDAYLLQALAEGRHPKGRLDLIYVKTSAAGDPRRPSRLLLRCRDADLPRRIEFLFRPAAAAASPAWTRAWRLTPRRQPAPTRVAVTGLRAWLACPFRFYLQHGLKMEAVDAAKEELDARDFGTLCHAALEAMAKEASLCGCTDEAMLREYLIGELDRVARERFGPHPGLPVVVQLESARQRLARAAVVQAREHAAGWRIERIEWPFALELGGLEVRGRIDRVDRHEPTGAWRVLDYKTSDAAPPPPKTHLRPRRSDEAGLPDWRIVPLGGREYVWADLQLPVYLRALGREATGATSLVAGYFNLPRAAGETALALWPELTDELLASAAACADGVAAAIRAGEFWPPAELAAERDPFGALFHHGAADSIAWEEVR